MIKYICHVYNFFPHSLTGEEPTCRESGKKADERWAWQENVSAKWLGHVQNVFKIFFDSV